MKATLAGRLNSRLIAAPDTACRLWTGCTNSRGYGVISDGGKRALVHRVAWRLEHGPIPDGMTIDHVWNRGCRYKTCALVAHLEPVTMAVNIQRSHHNNPRGPRGPVVTIDLTDDRLPPPPPPSEEAFAAARLLDRLFEQAEIDAFIERNRVKVTAVPKAQAS